MAETCTEYFDRIDYETDDAYLFKIIDDSRDYWLPKSQIIVNELSNGYEVELPVWLAEQKALI